MKVNKENVEIYSFQVFICVLQLFLNAYLDFSLFL